MTTDFTIEESQWLNGMKDPGAADDGKIMQFSFCGQRIQDKKGRYDRKYVKKHFDICPSVAEYVSKNGPWSSLTEKMVYGRKMIECIAIFAH